MRFRQRRANAARTDDHQPHTHRHTQTEISQLLRKWQPMVAFGHTTVRCPHIRPPTGRPRPMNLNWKPIRTLDCSLRSHVELFAGAFYFSLLLLLRVSRLSTNVTEYVSQPFGAEYSNPGWVVLLVNICTTAKVPEKAGRTKRRKKNKRTTNLLWQSTSKPWKITFRQSLQVTWRVDDRPDQEGSTLA